jgi:hypothetical protein
MSACQFPDLSESGISANLPRSKEKWDLGVIPDGVDSPPELPEGCGGEKNPAIPAFNYQEVNSTWPRTREPGAVQKSNGQAFYNI